MAFFWTEEYKTQKRFNIPEKSTRKAVLIEITFKCTVNGKPWSNYSIMKSKNLNLKVFTSKIVF
ncbi:hypothetical protein HI914_01988 [Erysiphe necator]|nr:hypothetical protein HI914_01988 [Erysiphe necator]